MSWDEQMKTLCSYTGDKMFYGGIFGLDGNVWGSNCKGTLNVTKAEAETLAKVCANDSTELAKAQQGGLHLGGNKFRFLRSDSDEKSVTFTRTEGENKLHNGFAIQTKQAILICVCEEEGKGSAAAAGTCRLAEYLCSVGY